MRFTLRRATACDTDAIANVFSASFRLLTFLPMLHTVEEDGRYIQNVILNECEVTVAEDESEIVAFLARQGEEVRAIRFTDGAHNEEQMQDIRYRWER